MLLQITRWMQFLAKGNQHTLTVSCQIYILLELVSIIKGTYRNITMDNLFTSIELAYMFLQAYTITILGTMEINKRAVSQEVLEIIEFYKQNQRNCKNCRPNVQGIQSWLKNHTLSNGCIFQYDKFDYHKFILYITKILLN